MATSRFGLRVAPLLLRLSLGFTFLWAGLGKFAAMEPVSGDDAAILANMGVIPPPAAALIPSNSTVRTTSFEQGPAQPSGTPAPAPKTYLGSDFPNPVKTMRVNLIALSVYKAAHPAPREDGSTPMLLWPARGAEGKLPVYFAWTAGLSELVGGSFLLLGFLARLSALFVSGTMVGALWLAQIGPALQSGVTRWGFLPKYDLYAGGDASYVGVLWPFALLMAALSVMLLGAGALSVDSVLFGPSKPPPPPKPAPPKPAG
ncbi:MAG: DoxX family membrane protein [Tepidisphaera sp.]|nr:DoxX family membrane protein [Tepidisphaera sp.]